MKYTKRNKGKHRDLSEIVVLAVEHDSDEHKDTRRFSAGDAAPYPLSPPSPFLLCRDREQVRVDER